MSSDIEFIYIAIFIFIIIFLILRKSKPCIYTSCNGTMYSQGSYGDGVGGDYDYTIYKCNKCGRTYSELIN